MVNSVLTELSFTKRKLWTRYVSFSRLAYAGPINHVFSSAACDGYSRISFDAQWQDVSAPAIGFPPAQLIVEFSADDTNWTAKHSMPLFRTLPYKEGDPTAPTPEFFTQVAWVSLSRVRMRLVWPYAGTANVHIVATLMP